MPRTHQSEFLLDNLWIIERETGNCFFEHDFNSDLEEIKHPLDVISSFFTAFSSLVDTIYSDKIKKIHFQGRRLYFKATEELVFIASVKNTNKTSDSKIDRLLSKIIDRFNHKYSQKINILNDFSIKSDFYGFIDTLEGLVRTKNPSAHFLHIF